MTRPALLLPRPRSWHVWLLESPRSLQLRCHLLRGPFPWAPAQSSPTWSPWVTELFCSPHNTIPVCSDLIVHFSHACCLSPVHTACPQPAVCPCRDGPEGAGAPLQEGGWVSVSLTGQGRRWAWELGSQDLGSSLLFSKFYGNIVELQHCVSFRCTAK